MSRPGPHSSIPFASAVRQAAGRESAGQTLVVAEVGQSHDGSLGTAHAFIDAIATTGADAVKFQTHLAEAETTRREEWRVKFSRQDASRYDYWVRMGFSEQQWCGLKEHCEQVGLLFLSSAFSVEAVELLHRVGVPAWKVASGELTNVPMLRAMSATGLPIIVSTGMSTWSELQVVVDLLQRDNPLCLLQCTTSYPCPPERIGLNVMSELGERFATPVGLSDHSGTIFPSIAAATLGASAIEVHATLSPFMFGPDVSSSLTIEELRQLVEGIRFVERIIANPVDKEAAAEALTPMRKLFMKSIVAKRDISRGTIISADDIAFKKPGGGLAPEQIPELIGRVAGITLRTDDVVTLENTTPS